MLKEVIMMQIKTMQHDDFIENAPIIQRLLKASYVSSFKMSEDLCNRTVEFKIHELGEYVKSEKTKLVGAFIKDSLVGFIWLYIHDYFGENRLHINHIAIENDFRRLGIAKKLLYEAEKLAAKLKIYTIDLFVSEENSVAVKMYEDLGYVTERRYLKKNFQEN